jgi:hypothetical protein
LRPHGLHIIPFSSFSFFPLFSGLDIRSLCY